MLFQSLFTKLFLLFLPDKGPRLRLAVFTCKITSFVSSHPVELRLGQLHATDYALSSSCPDYRKRLHNYAFSLQLRVLNCSLCLEKGP